MSVAVLAAAAFLALAMAGAAELRWRTGRSGFIDAIWSLSTALAAAGLALSSWPGAPSPFWRRAGAAALVLVWGLRLARHLARRASEGDDPRYAAMIAAWGARARPNLLGFLEAQAAAGLALAASVGLAAHAPGANLRWQDALGAGLFVAALVGEAAADRQLARFRADPVNAGRVCDVGLWSRSRHPNYFCEWLAWVAVAVAAFAPLAWPPGLLAMAAPALMYHLLVNVSGVPPLEERMARTRPRAFAEYVARTPKFFPRLARRRARP
ncbi:MAG: DUF1295 domain-containing protein [Hyphomicrobiales bacterium]|nr:DUF1295 domain-containing protein [Hyphomicrobiales bacterium]